MFKEEKSRVDVAIAPNFESYETIHVFHDYLQLLNLDRLVTTHQYLGNNLPIFLDLFVVRRNEGIVTQPAIARLVQSAGKLTRLEEESLKLCEQIGDLATRRRKSKKTLNEQAHYYIIYESSALGYNKS